MSVLSDLKGFFTWCCLLLLAPITFILLFLIIGIMELLGGQYSKMLEEQEMMEND